MNRGHAFCTLKPILIQNSYLRIEIDIIIICQFAKNYSNNDQFPIICQLNSALGASAADQMCRGGSRGVHREQVHPSAFPQPFPSNSL